MTPRHFQLLDGLTRAYIQTGLPVGSVGLIERMNLSFSPATVRYHLHDLEEAGLVYQPHASAGRIPTDRGFRVFVDRLNQQALSSALQRQVRRRHQALIASCSPATAAAEIMAEVAGTIALGAERQTADINEAGWRQLVEQYNQEDNFLNELREVCQILSELEARQLSSLPADTSDVRVYIGTEIPFHRARYTSLVVGHALTPDGELVTLALIGLKRMPYARNLSLVGHLAKVINES
jgi:transcriptional regulator of heat shock response